MELVDDVALPLFRILQGFQPWHRTVNGEMKGLVNRTLTHPIGSMNRIDGLGTEPQHERVAVVVNAPKPLNGG